MLKEVSLQPREEMEAVFGNREQHLHKVIAASGFLFALLILPVAQYTLVATRLPAEGSHGYASVSEQGQRDEESSRLLLEESGQVAGVQINNTDEGSVAGVLSCQESKLRDLNDLDKWRENKKIALWRQYEEAVRPYQEAILALTGTPEYITQEKSALEGLINREYQPYLIKLSEVERAVESQKGSVSDWECLPPQ